jgi:hypothetical protein
MDTTDNGITPPPQRHLLPAPKPAWRRAVEFLYS